MSVGIEHWKSQLVDLTPDECVELAHFLLSTLEPEDSDAEVEAAWDAEASRRAEEIRSGAAIGTPAEDLLITLRERCS
jgi:putative addiction module component (TIGR02574 family)